MNSPIEYIANWCDLGTTSIKTVSGLNLTYFDLIKEEAVWEQRDAPRKECFMSSKTDTYTYGSGNGIRTYYPIPYGGYTYILKKFLEKHCGCEFEACFLNYYEGPRDHLGWHADDSDVIDPTRPIGVISLGSKREIWFRDNETKTVEKLSLDPGSLLIMKAGMQQTHEHRIPKHGANCGPRLSLTFRGLKSNPLDSTVQSNGNPEVAG